MTEVQQASDVDKSRFEQLVTKLGRPVVTAVTLLVDESGSMAARRFDTIGAINRILEDQKPQPNEKVLVTLWCFDTGNRKKIYTLRPIEEVSPISVEQYRPNGGTPLVNAAGEIIDALMASEVQIDRHFLTIITDGGENDSGNEIVAKRYTKADIQAKMQEMEKSGIWTTIFIGANIDAWGEARGTLGVTQAYVGNVRATQTPEEYVDTLTYASTRMMAARSKGMTAVSNMMAPDEDIQGVSSVMPGTLLGAKPQGVFQDEVPAVPGLPKDDEDPIS